MACSCMKVKYSFSRQIAICFHTFESSFSFFLPSVSERYCGADAVLSPQAAQSVNKALEQFVKPEQLDGENSYKCSKYAVCGRWARGPGLPLAFLPLGRRHGAVSPEGCRWETPCLLPGQVCLEEEGHTSSRRVGRHGLGDCPWRAGEAVLEWESPSLQVVKVLLWFLPRIWGSI